jgi:hypothetical protein
MVNITSEFSKSYSVYANSTGDTRQDLRGQLGQTSVGVNTLFTQTLKDLAKNGGDTNAIYSQFASQVGPKVIEQFANLANLPISEVEEQFKKTIDSTKLSIKTTQGSKKAGVSADAYFETLQLIPRSFGDASISINRFTQQVDLAASNTRKFDSALGDIADFTKLGPQQFAGLIGESSVNAGFAGNFGNRLTNQKFFISVKKGALK